MNEEEQYNQQNQDDPMTHINQKNKKKLQRVGKWASKKINQVSKKAGRALLKGLWRAFVVTLPYTAPIILIFIVAVCGYYIQYEIRGSQQIYVFDDKAKNDTEKDEKNVARTNASLLSSGTKEIQQYYNYMSQHSFWQILGDDNTKLEQNDEVRDYYQREQDYLLNSNLLYSLDATMHKMKFIYPEQFVKPVHYDPKKLELSPLTDEKGKLIVESEEYDEEGKKTGKKVKSVSDYGLGSIFKYAKAVKTVTVEGTMYKKEVWDDECGCKETVDTNEPFVYTMDGYPEDIWIISKAITFVGEYTFHYKDVKTKQADLTDNSVAGKPNEAVTKVLIGEAKVETEDGKTTTVPLYGYRKGAVYQTLPTLQKTDFNDKGQDYLMDFLLNYRVFVPANVLEKFDLEERAEANNIDLSKLQGGSLVNSEKFKRVLQYFPIVQKYAQMYGVDPYLVLAQIAQESGGVADIEDGLMQITGDGYRSVSALNVQTGQKDTFAVHNEADRRNPEIAIRWGIMYFANLTSRMDGDPLKAIQAYNFGEGGVLWIKKNYPEAWNSTAWLNYREDSRLHYGGSDSRSASYDCIPDRKKTSGRIYGDSCYVEHVLRYYAGSNINTNDLSQNDNGKDENSLKNLITSIFQNVKEAVSRFVKDYKEETIYYPYNRYIQEKEIDWALDLVIALDNYKLFSEVESEDSTDILQFWNKRFNEQVVNGNGEMFTALSDVDGFQIPYNKPGAIITSLPGTRIDPVYGGTAYHAGTDIALPKNTPIYATADGTIIKAHTGETEKNGNGLGNHVKIQHANGIVSIYGHLTSLVVREGETVKKGQLIGYSGTTGKSTGYHLHFEIRQNGVVMDSSIIIKGSGNKLLPAP